MSKAGIGVAAAGTGFVMAATLALMFGATADSDGDTAEAATGGITAGLNLKLLPAAGRTYADWYIKSAQNVADECPKISAPLLAAQGMQESGFNPDIRGPQTQYGQAVGIAQFLPSTYATWGRDSDGDGRTGPTDPEDAIMAQGKFMCSLYKRAVKAGYGDPVELALAGYNAGWGRVEQYHGVPPYQETQHYVAVITATAKKWSAALGSANPSAAVRRAYTQLGTPYAYGGGTPSGPGYGMCSGGNGYRNGKCLAATTKGWDCSSLTQYAYWPTLQLPRTAADQYEATANRSVDRSELQPGDLVFWSYGGSGGIYHVALYYGNGKILHAPRTGRSVGFDDLDTGMPKAQYFGATRPGK